MASLLLLIVLVLLSLGLSDAYKHYVNGQQGWVPHPSQDYNQWSGHSRFLVHDTLYFKYKKDQDSVLEVTKQDYDSCNTDNPTMKSTDGETEIQLDHPGPFYFISGNKTNCQQGQKLTVVVITPRGQSMSPPPSSSTGAPPSHGGPPAMVPTPSHSNPPSGSGSGPTSSMSPPSPGSPGATSPSGAMSPPGTTSPGAMSPSGSMSPPGATSPATSPSSGSPGASSPMTSPSGATSSPATSPTGTTSSPATSPAGSMSSPATSSMGSMSSPAESPGKEKSVGVKVNAWSMGVGFATVLITLMMWS